VIGRIGAPHGVKGWVRIVPFAELPGVLAERGRWWIGGRGEWTEVEVAETRMHGAKLAARLAACTDRDAAARLRGCDIAVPRERLPQSGPNEYYWADLIGLEVVNTRGVPLGPVTGVFTTGANDVLRVGEGKRERLLPFVATVIRAVDLAARRIEVDWEPDW
jgi:16S rRNA processing protein RimM